LFISLAFAVAAALCCVHLRGLSRIIVLVQLCVLSIILQWGLSQLGRIETHSSFFVLAILSGAAAGYGIQKYDLRRKNAESQYYELLLRNRELQETKLQIVKQDEVERRMLAADLHDQVLNDL